MSNRPITKEDFQRYVKVQESGVCNMLSSQVRDYAFLTKEQHTYILKNYKQLSDEYDIHPVFKKGGTK